MRLLEKYPQFRELIMSASPALVDISDAANWYWCESPQDDWDLSRDMHALTPPHDFTYMEFSMPERINVNGELRKSAVPGASIGCMVTGREIQEEFRTEAQRSWLMETFVSQAYASIPGNAEKMWKIITKDEGWLEARERGIALSIAPSFLLDSTVFLDTPQGIQTIFRCVMYLDEFGKAYPGDNGTLISPGVIPNRTMDDLNYFLPFAFAVSLMNCKNVHLVDDQRHLIRQQRRKMERDGNPIIDYKWLHIKQLTKRVNEDAERSKTGRHNRLHFVRAHWATYTADAPLFGKYQGVFFKPSHVKGSASAGMSLKGYKVEAP